MTETQQRFLRAIAERVDAARVVEARLFPSIRTGPVESGVAIVAVEVLPDPAVEREVERVVAAEHRLGAPASGEAGGADDLPRGGDERFTAQAHAPARSEVPVRRRAEGPIRCSILTAHYRLTLKGPDRGKWEFEIVHDADAPIETVEHVVRGVARRAGEDGEPDLLPAAEFQRAITEPWWSAPAT